MNKIAQEKKLKEQWAAVRGDMSKSASTIAFEELKRQEAKDQREREAFKALAAQDQRFRYENEAFQAEVEAKEAARREAEGVRVRNMVIQKGRDDRAARLAAVEEAALG